MLVLVSVSIGGYRWLYRPYDSTPQMKESEVTQSVGVVDSIIATKNTVIATSVSKPTVAPATPKVAPTEKSADYVWEELPYETQVSNSTKAKIVATQEVTRVVDVLYCHLDDLSKMRKDTTLSSAELLAAMRDFTTREERYFDGIKRHIIAEQPDISADDLYILVYNSQKALDYIKQSNIVQEKVGAEFRRRYIKEHGEEPPRVIP